MNEAVILYTPLYIPDYFILLFGKKKTSQLTEFLNISGFK